ncbi:MAG: phosphatidate cytidylyltransferase [Chitinophagaceae bacterium]|nr:phosphatidate cytidylyltransferase [Chitinophagaceae bacterium]
MAFNWQTFKTRALTAVVFVVVMLTGLLWNHWSFFILFSIIHFGCWTEYQKLVGLIDPGYKEITPFHKYGVMLAGWCLMLWFSGDDLAIGDLRLHEMGWWIGLVLVFLLPITELLFSKNIRLKNIAHSFFGLVYISLSWGLMMDLYSTIADIHLHDTMFVIGTGVIPVIIILSIWINDTMAYIVGSLIGKTPLSPISPKKTWEGTVGGILLAIIVVGFLFPLIYFGSSAFTLFLFIAPIAAIAAIVGTYGDLLESKLKRLAGVKDSGQIMPGHGGFLDRFDSLLLATPFVWLYVQLFMK